MPFAPHNCRNRFRHHPLTHTAPSTHHFSGCYLLLRCLCHRTFAR